MTFDFSFNETQKMIQASARGFFEKASSSDAVRVNEASSEGYDPVSWKAMADLGWLGLGVPEHLEGSGGSFTERLPIYEEMGRHLFPTLHLDVVSLAGAAILRLGSPKQQKQYLTPVTHGELIIVPAIINLDGTPLGRRASHLEQSADGYKLNGKHSFVAYANSADLLLWLASPTDGGPLTAFLVDTHQPGVSMQPIQNTSRQPIFEVELNNVVVTDSNRLGPPQDISDIVADILLQAAVLQCACIVGSARRVLEMTVDYAKTREQFGNAIGKYQAVQYMITDMVIDLHRADLLTKQAAYRIESGWPYRRQAAIAVAFSKRAAARIHRQAHEVHAGVAFIEDHELPLFSRRSKYLENHLGDARWYEDLVATETGLNSTATTKSYSEDYS